MAKQPEEQLRQALAASTGLPLSSPEIALILVACEKAARRMGQILVDTGYGSVTVEFANKKLAKVGMTMTEM